MSKKGIVGIIALLLIFGLGFLALSKVGSFTSTSKNETKVYIETNRGIKVELAKEVPNKLYIPDEGLDFSIMAKVMNYGQSNSTVTVCLDVPSSWTLKKTSDPKFEKKGGICITRDVQERKIIPIRNVVEEPPEIYVILPGEDMYYLIPKPLGTLEETIRLTWKYPYKTFVPTKVCVAMTPKAEKKKHEVCGEETLQNSAAPIKIVELKQTSIIKEDGGGSGKIKIRIKYFIRVKNKDSGTPYIIIGSNEYLGYIKVNAKSSVDGFTWKCLTLKLDGTLYDNLIYIDPDTDEGVTYCTAEYLYDKSSYLGENAFFVDLLQIELEYNYMERKTYIIEVSPMVV